MDAIQQALSEYKVPKSWWPLQLINGIQEIDIALLIPWVASCILDSLTYEEHPKATLVSDRVRRTVTATPEEIDRLLAEYETELHESGNKMLVSYRDLIQAKKYLFSNDVIGIRTQIVWSLILLGECDYARRTDIQFVIKNYSKVIADFSKCGI
jgi:hypothetical protein